MKSQYGFLSAAVVAVSVLLGSGEASAGGGGWWGRAGYGSLRVREIQACIDDRTAELRVAFRAPAAAAWCGDFAVTAALWGDAVCMLPPPPPLLLPPPVPVYDPCTGALLPPPIVPVVVPPRGPIAEFVGINGFPTHGALAMRDYGDWYYADFDLLPLFEGLCGPGYLDDMIIDTTTIYIEGRPFVLDYDLPLCGDDWYGGW